MIFCIIQLNDRIVAHNIIENLLMVWGLCGMRPTYGSWFGVEVDETLGDGGLGELVD